MLIDSDQKATIEVMRSDMRSAAVAWGNAADQVESQPG